MRLIYLNNNLPAYDFEINAANVAGFTCKNKVLEITFRRTAENPVKRGDLQSWTWTGEQDRVANFKEVLAFLGGILKQTLGSDQQSLF